MVGTIGPSCANNCPCTYPYAAISSYFAIIEKANVADAGILTGKHLSTLLIASLASTASGINPEEGPFVVAGYPLVLPKLVGHNITEGSIFSKDVLASMLDYDPVASKWLEAHKAFVSKSELHGHNDDIIPLEFLPEMTGATISTTNHVALTSLWTSNDNDLSVGNQVQAKIEQITQKKHDQLLRKSPLVPAAANTPRPELGH
jgi:hypothetical protein